VLLSGKDQFDYVAAGESFHTNILSEYYQF